jgi:hypothetical protein
MEPTLDTKIFCLNSFFSYFYLNKENFSKNIQLQLKLLKPFLKFEKDLLSTLEKDKLIFVQSENICNIIKNNDESNKNFLKEMKRLDLLYSIVKRFNMDLKYNKEKMTNNYKSNEIDFEKKINDINYDLLLKKYEEQFGDIIKNNKNIDSDYISNEEIIKNKNQILNYKKEIEEISKKNKDIDLKLYELKKKLNNYKDLPTEIGQMKNFVEIKKEEYKSLLIDNKNKKI